jgi:predicted ATPase
VPSAVEQIVARRLDALTLPQRQVLHLAAVLGEEFDFNLLRTAGGTEPAGLLASLRELVQHRFLDETDRGYCFHHDKIRQVVYADIEDVDRPRLHRWVAQAMEHLHPGQVATLAHHWTAGEVWDRAADSHRQAGDGAAAVFAHAEAKAHYTRALDALGRLPEAPDEALLFELRSARGSIHGLMGERQAQAQDLAAMDDLADKLDDNRRRAQVAMLRGTAAEEMADYEAAIAAAQSLLQLSHEMQEEGIEATGQRQWGTALWRQGKYQDALDRLHRALALARSADSIREEAASLYEPARRPRPSGRGFWRSH